MSEIVCARRMTIDGRRYVKKESRQIDFSAEIESRALSDIYELAPELRRHYPERYASGDGWLIEREIDGDKLSEMIGRWIANRRFDIVRNIVAWTILVAEATRERTGIVNNELVPYNVIIVEAPDQPTVVPIEAGGKSFALETFGYLPVIVDMSMAFNPRSPVLATCHHTEVGMSVDVPDPICDARMLLTCAARKFGHATDRLVNVYEELFGNMPVHIGQIYFFDEFFADVYRAIDDRLSTRYEGPNYVDAFSIESDWHPRLLDLLICGVKMAMTDDPAGFQIAIASARLSERSSSVSVECPYSRFRRLVMCHADRFEDENDELRFVKKLLTTVDTAPTESRQALASLILYVAPAVLDTFRANASAKYEMYAEHLGAWNGAEVAERLLSV